MLSLYRHIYINTLVIAMIKRITYSAMDVDSKYIGSIWDNFENRAGTKGLRREEMG